MPRAATLGDFISKNSFNALKDDVNDEDVIACVLSPPTETESNLSCHTAAALKKQIRKRRDKSQRAKVPGTQSTLDKLFPDLRATLESEISEVTEILQQEETATQVPRLDVIAGYRPNNTARRQQQSRQICKPQCTCDMPAAGPLTLIEDEEELEDSINACAEEIKIQVAMDSGSVDNVTNPDTIPGQTAVKPNKTGKHFVGAGGERIKKHGECITMMTGKHGKVGCRWQVADVTRPLHSVSAIAGPEEGPGEHDVLFNNKRGVVVPPGVVERILQSVKPVAEYKRSGGLYLADMILSDVARQGQTA